MEDIVKEGMEYVWNMADILNTISFCIVWKFQTLFRNIFLSRKAHVGEKKGDKNKSW